MHSKYERLEWYKKHLIFAKKAMQKNSDALAATQQQQLATTSKKK